VDSKRIRQKVRDDYNQIAGDFSSTRQRQWKDFQRFYPYIKSKSSILDLGCGNGRLLLFLNELGFGSYLGVDQSEGLLKQARLQFPEMKFQESDMGKLKRGHQDKDIVFAIASFHHLPPADQLKALKTWRTHLKPGGVLMMTNWNLHQKKYRKRILQSVLAGYGFRGCLVPWKNEISRYYYAFTLRRLNKLLKKAGYQVIENEYVSDGKSSSIFSAKNILSIATV
jgi:ubiquinone/menaquinone biosynthesis C-methylase UbiE